jgi:hypothetical protein
MAATFEALSRDPEALQATIAKSPGTLDAGIASFTVQAPFLRRVAAFSRDLSGATAELPAALPPLTRALEVGAPVQRRAVALADDLQDALDAGLELTRAPTTLGAVRGLDATVTTLQPTLRYLGPFVTVCNNWNTFWTFTAEHFTAPDATGGAQRSLLNQGAPQEDSVTSMGANEFVHGHDVRPVNGGVPQHLHANTFGGQAVTPEGRANCQVGQQGYLHAANRFAKDQRTYGRVVVDTPTREQHDLELGSTYRTYDREGNGQGRNLPRVPAGQTFTAEPGGRGVNP